MAILLVVIGLIAIYLFNFYVIERRKLPPGPFPLPFVGNTLSFVKTPLDKCLQQWKDRYGDIMTIWVGGEPMVTLHNADVIYDTFHKDGDAYAGRMYLGWNEIVRGGPLGILFAEGPLWREHRRFALQAFRNLGLGRNIMQERILDDICALTAHVKTEIVAGNLVINMGDEIDISVGSIINSMMFGYRFSRENRSEFKKVKRMAQEGASFFNSCLYRAMDGNINLFRHLPVFKDIYAANIRHNEESREFFMAQVDAHYKDINLDSEEEPSDYVEAYLRQQYKLDKAGIKHSFDRNQLYAMVYDIWIAGQETTAITLSWMVIYMIKYPHVQRKAQAEIDEFIGDRIVTVEDKPNLKYVNALIAESQRMSNLLPMNAPHKTTKDVEILGYHIPKDTIIIDQISTVMHDERYFPDAEAFKPERFIDANGKFFQPPELMPFGVGKRACLGEGLARLELFLFTANLLNQFEFSEVPEEPITGERIITVTNSPVPWVCDVKLRH